MPFDHELKLGRALKHLQDLNVKVNAWVKEAHYTVRYAYEPNASWDGPVPPGLADAPPGTARSYLAGAVFPPGQPHVAPTGAPFGQGLLTAYVTAEHPPSDPISLLVGDALHNLRSSLDLLAFALASAHTKPLPKELADRSEFPIFGDENRKGIPGSGAAMFGARTRTGDPAPNSGLSKIQGWHPDAQTVVEGLQPYKRGKDFRSDPIWLIHDLDRVSKHRLLHPAVAAFSGTSWEVMMTRNIKAIGPGFYESRAGTLGTDTPIARVFGVHPIDPSADVHMEIHPALDAAFGDTARSAEGKPLMATLAELYKYVAVTVVPQLAPFL